LGKSTVLLCIAVHTSAQNILHTHAFLKMSCFQWWRYNSQQWDAVVCGTLLSRLIGIFFFYISQISGGYSQICSGLIAANVPPPLSDMILCFL